MYSKLFRPVCRLLWRCFLIVAFFAVGGGSLSAQFYPVHGVLQWPAPQSPHFVDYYSGSRDRLIITLHNRDLQQPLLLARLRIQIKSNGFLAQTREEMPYPMLELSAGTPTRLTATDLMPYLRPESLLFNGRLREGKLPTGFTEISVQVLDYYSRKELSAWHTARAYLDSKHPPILNLPQRDEQVSFREPLFLRFQWYPRHQGLAGTEYEFVLKELPDNGAAPQSAFAYGNEIYRVRTRNTFLNYTHLEPILLPNRRYAWQVQAIARDGVDEIGMFENRGFSEIYWFSLNENCPVPTGLKAQARYAKADFSWDRVVGATGYMLACRPKTSKNIYEWSEVLSYGERITLAQLKPGWTYEWRVGTLCTSDKPIYSAIQELTLPKSNLDLLANCGKEPPRTDLSPQPALDIQVGDTITIGGDYPMLITELKSLGDGWYSGRGKTSLRSIIEVPHVALRFDRLRINVDNFQIDGLVEAVYDDKKALANLDQLDDGGKVLSRGSLRIRERKVAFALPDAPEMNFNPETGELEMTDAEGKPQRIKLELPEGAKPESVFPMVITDSEGKSYQVTEPQSEYKDDARRSIGATKDDLIPQRKALQVEPVERVSGFRKDKLETKTIVRFVESGAGRYTLDPASEDWYRKAVKLDTYYKPFDKGYIAPWKLVPVGERDAVEAYIDKGEALPSEVRFVLESGQSLPASFDEATQRWRLELPSVGANESYDIFALVAGKTAGKLRVVSYPKAQYKLRLVPVNGQSLGELTALARELNAIYNPLGISFALTEGEGMQTAIDKSQLKRELRRLIRDYQEEHSLEADEVCVFVLNPTLSKGTKFEDLEGLMPRNSRFGYIFAGNSPNEAGSTDVVSLARTLAHELGHGLFTLRHTFDSEYGTKKSRSKTSNLMDYSEGAKSLAAFQWNIIANPAPLTALDREKDAELVTTSLDVRAFLRQIRTYKDVDMMISVRGSSGRLNLGENFFNYTLKGNIYVYAQKGENTFKVSSITKEDRYLNAYNREGYQIHIANAVTINCHSKEDRDELYNFLIDNDSLIFDKELVALDRTSYSYQSMYRELDRIRRELALNGKYLTLDKSEKLILDLPLIMWSKKWFYGAIFMYNWITSGGDIYLDEEAWRFLDNWSELRQMEQKFKVFILENLNKKIERSLEEGSFRLYPLRNVRGYANLQDLGMIGIGQSMNAKLRNFASYETIAQLASHLL